jgi:hypothetical protein
MLPFIFCPLTTVPIFVARSSILTCDRLDRLCACPSATLWTVIVKCLREMVLCEIASCPAEVVDSVNTYFKSRCPVKLQTYALLRFSQRDTFCLGAAIADGLRENQSAQITVVSQRFPAQLRSLAYLQRPPRFLTATSPQAAIHSMPGPISRRASAADDVG